MDEALKIGDRFQNGVILTDESIMWGTIQTVLRLQPDGAPTYRAKWGKVDKIAEHWRTPPVPDSQHKPTTDGEVENE